MNRKAVSTAAMFMIAGTVSACNSTDGPYRQGPWGPASTPRSYPSYSAPWGGPPAGPVYGVAVQPVYGSVRKGDEIDLEPDLPPVSPRNRPTLDVDSHSEVLPGPGLEHSPLLHREASAPAAASDPGVFTPPQRASSYAGSWKASVGSVSCRIQLSSVPSLDLYKASAQGCSNNALKAINGWSIRDNQVILFSRGQVIARLSGAEAALSGRMNGSETELTMTR
jgi:hypothetical protein